MGRQSTVKEAFTAELFTFNPELVCIFRTALRPTNYRTLTLEVTEFLLESTLKMSGASTAYKIDTIDVDRKPEA